MSRVELEVVLGRPGPFVPGETLEGFVGITVNRNCTCRAVTVDLQWFTHGRGNKRSGTSVSQTVFSGDLVAGEKGLHPFALTVPPGPFSYAGHNLHLDWRVRGAADLSWALDAKDDVPVSIVPGDQPLSDVRSGNQNLAMTALRYQMAGVIRGAVGLLFGGMGTVFLVCGGFTSLSMGLSQGSLLAMLPGLLFVFVPGVFIAVGLFLVGGAIRQLIAQRKVKALRIDLADTVFPGEDIEAQVVLEPRGDLAVEEIRLVWTCEERTTRGSGTNKRTFVHPVFERTVVVARPGLVRANGPSTYASRLTLPKDAPLSLALTDNAVVWTVRAVVDCPGPLDPETLQAVRVVPEVAVRRS